MGSKAEFFCMGEWVLDAVKAAIGRTWLLDDVEPEILLLTHVGLELASGEFGGI